MHFASKSTDLMFNRRLILGHLLPLFKAKTGIVVHVIAQGTGQALDTARRGDADVVFVHAKPQEEKFVADGFGVRRFDVMHNGNWFTVYTRFWRWAQKGVWERVFNVLSDDPDFECVLLDETHVRVHQHGTGAKGGLASRPSARRVAV